MNGYGMEEFVVDGGIICNNPSMYAYLQAKYLQNHTNIRVMSLGTGRDIESFKAEMSKQRTWNKFSTDFTSLLTTFEQLTASSMLKTLP